MKNHQLEAAWAYHNGTKHSVESIRASRHYLDWDNQPIPFKIYSELEPIPLPQHLSSSGVPALSAIGGSNKTADAQLVPTSQTIAELLFLSAGITKTKGYPGGEMRFRAAACTGALYHIDLYIVCDDLAGLDTGVYHFSPHDFALRRLRKGNYRSVLARASGQEPSIVASPCVILCASTFWRNAWKYQARAYRHCYWDNGTILANLLAAAAARTVPAKVVVGFIDDTIRQLLGLDAKREAPLSMVALGEDVPITADRAPELEPVEFRTAPLSKREVDYPVIREMHEASSLESEGEVAAWRAAHEKTRGAERQRQGDARRFSLDPLRDDEIPRDTLEEVILRRGSTREFAREAIDFRQLSTMLAGATRPIAADFLSSPEDSLNELYLIVNAVEGLPSGAYVLRREEQILELLKEGNFRPEAGHLGLGQEIPADCSADVFILADLNHAFERFGNRGYRAAQLEASVMGGKLYLAAYALRLGASGLTFFDDDVTDFFSPDAAGKSAMFLIALGKSMKRSKGLRVV
jgi:SagB-type dehydrogenase family enzyme